MIKIHPAKTLALAMAGCTALWAVQASADTSIDQATLNQLQQQIQQLQNQVQALKAKQQANAEKQQKQLAQVQQQQAAAAEATGADSDTTLNVHAGLEASYTVHDKDNNHRGGSLDFDHFMIGVAGDMGNGITFDSEYRFDSGANYLHYGWAAYDFNDSNQLKGGYFQVPYGNLDYGYMSYWAPVSYYLGLNDAQAAGLGYTYENDGWRFDLAAFKNQDLGQSTTYAGVTASDEGYHAVNGGAIRLARTFDFGHDNSLNISASGKGGQLNIDVPGYNHKNGSHWAAALAATANVGLWTFMAQVNDYRYNVPSGAGVDQGYVIMQEGGGTYKVPASGELYSLSFNRNIPVSGLGPISEFNVYDDFAYLHHADAVGYVNADGRAIGATTENILGVSSAIGPIMIWAEWIAAKNGGLAYAGANDGDWHHTFELTAGLYFDGNLL